MVHIIKNTKKKKYNSQGLLGCLSKGDKNDTKEKCKLCSFFTLFNCSFQAQMFAAFFIRLTIYYIINYLNKV